MHETKHLCDTCILINDCPKAQRYAEVDAICERHLDAIEAEIKARPRDTEHEEYTLGIRCDAIVMACPYYRDATKVS